MTESAVLAPSTLEAPTREAQSRAREARDLAEKAKRQLTETVRLRAGEPGPNLVDDVARTHGLDVVVVQKALWSMLASGQLVLENNAAVTLPVSSGASA